MRWSSPLCSLIGGGILVIGTILLFINSSSLSGPRVHELAQYDGESAVVDDGTTWLDSFTHFSSSYGPAQGGVIMKELGNATIRAELGSATWRLLHTMASRYPKVPNADEQAALRSFIHLLSRLYPCGQCAKHFQKLLQRYPPETASREAASQWACKVHNIVNERLDKPQFDCSTVLSIWKCGCADDVAEGATPDDENDTLDDTQGTLPSFGQS